MQKNSNRKDRIAEMIQRKLAQIILQEIKDPRLPSFVTISAVKVTSDLAHAKIFFTALTDEKKQVEKILTMAASFLRTALARSINLRTVPQLHFIYDESIEYGLKLSRIIDNLDISESDENT